MPRNILKALKLEQIPLVRHTTFWTRYCFRSHYKFCFSGQLWKQVKTVNLQRHIHHYTANVVILELVTWWSIKEQTCSLANHIVKSLYPPLEYSAILFALLQVFCYCENIVGYGWQIYI